ncbi:sugar phosphate isomerase/epimerase family protein [Cohnella hashimotonis]|uniref:Sugar phosphate isomerase/epimerase n=1 Tax=Cohnella hashimotonis TaxID=2826895 RepID=A0ABT6TE99_9BACL|nr:sugar phosphate isomerase/epimerase [Cohnella hashimotonis]MDI4645142.1 sugar phosphate isomerase/epimerase [Cohnella hashimotonis]
MKLGISSYTLTWRVGVTGYDMPSSPLTAQGLLLEAYRHGIQLVQIADNLPLHLMSEGELLRLKMTAQSLNVELEIGTRGTDPAHLLRYLHIAQLLDARLLRTLIIDSDPANAVRQIRQVLPLFKKAGVQLSIENHGLHTTKQLARLFEEIADPLVGCCLDTVNSFSALDSPREVIGNLMPYLLNLHLKDFEIKRVEHQMGFVITGTSAGLGKLNIPNLLDEVRRQRKDHANAILELWTPYQGTVESTVSLEQKWMERSLGFLKPMFNAIGG